METVWEGGGRWKGDEIWLDKRDWGGIILGERKHSTAQLDRQVYNAYTKTFFAENVNTNFTKHNKKD